VGDPAQRGWRRHPRILGVGGLALAGIAVAIALLATGASGTSGYRTAQATLATVRQTISLSGTVDPVHQASVAFQAAGTVSALNVDLGQQVTAGENLASLDPTTLRENVSSAQSSLSSSDAKLSEDEAAQASSTTSSSSTTTTTTTTAPSTTPPGGEGTALGQAQQKVVTTQQTADADSQQAATALTRAQAACGGSGGGATTTTTTPTTTTTTSPPTNSTACTDVLDAALAAQQKVAADQRAVATAESTLAQMLSSSSAGSTGNSGASTGGSGSNGGSGPSGSAAVGPGSSSSPSSGSSAGGGAASNSAAQLASDQAAIDSAEASLIEAQQLLADAQLVSPLTGTIAAVGLSVGQSVSAGSTTDSITIIDSGSYQVTASLTGAQSYQVEVGDSALVSVNGMAGTLTGTVARVGPVEGSGSSYTYPLVVALPAGSHGISAGSSAQLQVVLHEVKDTLAVPTSAVSTAGLGNSHVLVLQAGQELRKKVVVGVVGALYTQITSGIGEGTTVVLADLSEAVPPSSSSLLVRGFGRGGLGGRAFTGRGGLGG